MTTPQLQIDQVSIRYDQLTAVDNLSMTLDTGQIGCLLGPSGCGKTSLLRAIAGLEPVSEGEITLRGTLVSSPRRQRPPEKRNVGMVFQDFALFPHLNVADNIAFALGRRASQHTARVRELLRLIDLPDIAESYPHQLSGGQQQRVALARALAPEPDILLMDEPFSAVDVERRESLARQVREILRETDTTALMVTHDQQEAFTVADKVGVMKAGKLLQWDTAYTLYHRPNCVEVADFVGRGTLLRARVRNATSVDTELGVITTSHSEIEHPPGSQVLVLVRPDDVAVCQNGGVMTRVEEQAFKGALRLYTLRTPEGQKIYCYRPSHEPPPGDGQMRVGPAMDHMVLFAMPSGNQPAPDMLGGPFAT